MDYDVIIIGAGIAGLTAAIYTSRAGKNALVLETSAIGGQIVNALRVENWPGDNGISGADLMNKIYHHANEFDVKIKYEEVISVDKIDDENGTRRFVVRTEECEYSCGAIIIATGAEPRRLSTKQVKDAGDRPISYCATCDGVLYKGKPVVVVGSGNTAKHEIEYLKDIASRVYHIHHDDPIPKEAVAVFAAIGRVPATERFVDLVELDEKGYIVANEDCVTSCPGVFVAGDCRTKIVRQLVTAAADGAVAANAVVEYLN